MRTIKRPKAKIPPISGKQGLDIIQILPVTDAKNILLAELDIPTLGIQYRILEIYLNDEDIYGKSNELLRLSGISVKNLHLIKKGQPFNIGEYARDVATYFFIAKDATVTKEPHLNFQVPYRIKELSFNELLELRKNSKLENSSLMNLNSKKIQKYLL